MKNKVAGILLSLAISLLFFEGGFAFVLQHSQWFRLQPGSIFKSYYMDFDRHIISYMPACAVYDRELAYVLKTGTCQFKNREFDVQLNINSAGVRDREDLLTSPDVIVLGDSYAMGWGVGQDESFAKQLEKSTGLRILDAGVPSYGTVRELKLFQRLDRSHLKYLVIQYCDNDLEENRRFLEAGNSLVSMPEGRYQEIVENHRQDLRYYPLKYLSYVVRTEAEKIQRHTARISGHAAITPPAAQPNPDEEVQAFIGVLHAFRESLQGIPIFVVGINGSATNNSRFSDALKRRIAKEDNRYPAALQNMKVVDVSTFLTEKDYLTLDDHLNAAGHAIVARELKKAMNL